MATLSQALLESDETSNSILDRLAPLLAALCIVLAVLLCSTL